MNNREIKKLVNLAIQIGQILLENGSETLRVENTIQRICNSRHIDVEIFTIPTGIFVSCTHEDEVITQMKRVKMLTIDLEIIGKVNDLSRTFVNSEMTLEALEDGIDVIKQTPHFKTSTVCLFAAIASCFFALMFGGQIIEAIFAFITTWLTMTFLKRIKLQIGNFVRHAVGGMLNTVIALILITFVYPGAGLSQIVIGSLMPLVPGVAMTNALRDTISGDYVSGISKLSEAILSAIAIALGVGLVLNIKVLLTGSV